MSQPNEETLALALQIADQQVRFDIETFCDEVVIDRQQWYDSTLLVDGLNKEAFSLLEFDKRYIELRGNALPYKVIRHPLFTKLYRFEDKQG